jgi:hypothetical protein
MSLHTNLQGRLRNTHLYKSHGLLPVFETVVNSIRSLEEREHSTTEGRITFKIQRGSQSSVFKVNTDSDSEDIVGFIIQHNGGQPHQLAPKNPRT